MLKNLVPKYDFDELDILRLQDASEDSLGLKRKEVVNLVSKINRMKKAAAEELFDI